MRFLVWLLIGRISLQVWLSLNLIDQAGLVEAVVKEYCDQMSCYQAEIIITNDDQYLKIYAECLEVML